MRSDRPTRQIQETKRESSGAPGRASLWDESGPFELDATLR